MIMLKVLIQFFLCAVLLYSMQECKKNSPLPKFRMKGTQDGENRGLEKEQNGENVHMFK